MPNALSRRIHRCPVTAFQKMISGKYKLRIMWDLKDGPLRYGEVRRGLLRGGDASEEITTHEVPIPELRRFLADRAAAGLAVDPKIYAGLFLVGVHLPA